MGYTNLLRFDYITAYEKYSKPSVLFRGRDPSTWALHSTSGLVGLNGTFLMLLYDRAVGTDISASQLRICLFLMVALTLTSRALLPRYVLDASTLAQAREKLDRGTRGDAAMRRLWVRCYGWISLIAALVLIYAGH
jgi:hypothetical protein